jgi:hypothetical protein
MRDEWQGDGASEKAEYMCSIKKPEIVIEHSKTTQKMQI